jgi:hypothetical protein
VIIELPFPPSDTETIRGENMFCKECRHAQAIFPNSAELVCEKIYDKITADNMDGPADNIVVDPDFGCIMYEPHQKNRKDVNEQA